MKNDESCVIELSALAAPKIDAPGDHLLFLEERIKEIRQRILDHKPTFVVMYGEVRKQCWEAIASRPFGPDNILTIGPTIVAFARHPVSYGLPSHYWFELAMKLRCQADLNAN
jgi:hypothetical protein